MKKYISVFTIMVMIFLAACSNQNTSSTPTSNENNTQSNSVDSPARLCWQAIKGRQQGVLPPRTIIREGEFP